MIQLGARLDLSSSWVSGNVFNAFDALNFTRLQPFTLSTEYPTWREGAKLMDYQIFAAAESGESSELVRYLQSQLDSLRNRIQELEIQNAELSSLVSNCTCRKMQDNVDSNCAVNSHQLEEMSRLKLGRIDKRKKNSKVYNTKIMFQSKRYVALKIMYFGQRFYGFASEAQKDPTVESEIFNALEKQRLIDGDRKKLQYSRCGRTDKGVSSVGQVISLFVRSNHKESGEFISEELYDGELDYVKLLNKVLPSDIRVIGWSPAPIDFSARFSCLGREYKYLFWRDNLNITAMENAGSKLVGEHDFRNFCKMDAVNVHSYRRRITLFEICPCNESFDGDQLCAIKIKGSAFLWHQVRCMVAVLFLIGQGLESPDVIELLLDIDNVQRKPQYKMAPEIPLVLKNCEFESLKFICSSDARLALQLHLENECRNYKLQAAIYHEALLSCSVTENDESALTYGVKKKSASHIPIMSRPTEPSYEERRSKLTRSIGVLD